MKKYIEIPNDNIRQLDTECPTVPDCPRLSPTVPCCPLLSPALSAPSRLENLIQVEFHVKGSQFWIQSPETKIKSPTVAGSEVVGQNFRAERQSWLMGRQWSTGGNKVV